MGFALLLYMSCSDERIEPLSQVDGIGGTLSIFKAYSLESIETDDPYGRVVFWESPDATITLVQISLFEVPEDANYTSEIMSGAYSGMSSTTLTPLDNISNTGEGYTFGEFATDKFFLLTDIATYGIDVLDNLDAHVIVMNGGTVISAGNIGANAEPIEQN